MFKRPSLIQETGMNAQLNVELLNFQLNYLY